MPRCPSCNKFASVEQNEPETNLEVSGDDKSGEVRGEVRLVLSAGCCGGELAESNQEFNIPFDHPVNDKHQVEIESEDAEMTDRYDGKAGTPSRYQRHFYGATVSVDLKCSCGWEQTVVGEVEEQASGFDSLA